MNSTQRAPAGAPKSRFLEVDSLRGIAALSVVIHHVIYSYDREYGHQAGMILTEVQFGILGVDMFFMISGFVIYWSLERTRHVADFARSRIIRLYPTYWACVLITFAVVSLVPVPERLLTDFKPWDYSLQDLAVNLLMFQEAFCWPHVEQLCVPSVDPVYWTLWFELRFYVFMGVFAAFGWTRRPVALIAGVITFIIALNILNRSGAVPGAYVNFVAYATLYHYGLLFMMGAVAYLLWAGRVSAAEAATLVVYALAGVFMIEGGAYGIKITLVFAGLVAVVMLRPAFIRSPAVVYLGTISYALYLVHSSIGYLINAYAYEWGWNGYVGVATAIAAAFLLATLVTYGIEKPAQRLLKRRRTVSSAPRVVIEPAERSRLAAPARGGRT